jgi:hypothetical protein
LEVPTWKLKETIQAEERILEPDTIAIPPDQNGRLGGGVVKIGRLEGQFRTILRVNNVV